MQLRAGVRLKVSKGTTLTFKAPILIQRNGLRVMTVLRSVSAHAIVLYVAGRPNAPIIFLVDSIRECLERIE
jgi:hypothetical protein